MMVPVQFGDRPGRVLDTGWHLLPDPMERSVGQQWWRSIRKPGFFFPSYDDDAFWPTRVPGAFNRVHPELKYYEGQVVYLLHFDAEPASDGERCLLHFEGVADRCRVYLNGDWLGDHDSGFTPFTVDATPVLAKHNRLMVLVDNRRLPDSVPGPMHDWTHEGGIHRPVRLYRVPQTYIREAAISTTLAAEHATIELATIVESTTRDRQDDITWQLIDPQTDQVVAGSTFSARPGPWQRDSVKVPLSMFRLWSPADPYLYRLEVRVQGDVYHDTVGLREVRTRGREILLNGQPVILRGVCTWTEDPERGVFSMGEKTSAITLDLLRKLHCNFARTGHCPASLEFIRACDRQGMLCWVEVPAYWIHEMQRNAESRRALHMLQATVRAMRNNPSIILWSIGNECLHHDITDGDSNLAYFLEAVDYLHEHDPSRLVTYTGGMEGGGNHKFEKMCPRPISRKLDVIALNSYSGMHDGADPAKPSEFGFNEEKIQAAASIGKPVILAEIGIDAVRGEQGFDYGESRQADFHAKVQTLFAQCVKQGLLQGLTPFVLNDYSTPIKLGRFQRGFNRKGLVDQDMVPKQAFDVVAKGYQQIEADHG